MGFKFEKLIVWQKALDLADITHTIALEFPKHELYSLSSQLKRAADSVSLNIAEGSIGQSDPEQNRFLNYALRSCSEVITCLYLAKRRNYIDDKKFEEIYNCTETIFKMISSLQKTIAK